MRFRSNRLTQRPPRGSLENTVESQSSSQAITELPVSRQPSNDSTPIVSTGARNQTVVELQELVKHPSGPTPVARLPPEILSYIFELHVVRLNERISNGPLRLTQVCKLWRDVAESDPHLWASIHVYFPESRQSRENDVQRVRPALELHLKRSGVLPLSLTFTDHRTYHPDTESLVTLFVDILRTHARRWKRISLEFAGGYFHQIVTFTPCDLSSLEQLFINADFDVMQRIEPQLRLSLESATNLRSFTYTGPGLAVHDDVDIRWENLEEVSLGFPSHFGWSDTLFTQFRHLAKCQNITTCSLGIQTSDRPLDIIQAITLPCLETFRVRRLSPYAHARSMIDLLVLPRLRSLEIDASTIVNWNENWHERDFSGLLERSGCSLLHLSIRDVDFSCSELVRCLTLSPTLTSLRFIPCPRPRNIVDVISKLGVSRIRSRGKKRGRVPTTLVSASPPLAPELREIALGSSVEEYLDLMIDMFRSRMGPHARARGVAPLRRVEMIFFDLWHDLDVDHVRGDGDRLERVKQLLDPKVVAQWASENSSSNENEGEKGSVPGVHEDPLEVSLVVDTPYLPGYIDV